MSNSPDSRPSYTISDAAKLAGVSRSTIRRYRESGKFTDAWKNRDGQWMIPLTNLLASGLHPGQAQVTLTEQPSSKSLPTGLAQAAQEVAQADHAHLQERLNIAERDLAVERARREGLEATLAEAQRRSNDLSMSLRMLEARKEPIATPPAEPAEAAAEPEARRKWWHWLVD